MPKQAYIIDPEMLRPKQDVLDPRHPWLGGDKRQKALTESLLSQLASKPQYTGPVIRSAPTDRSSWAIEQDKKATKKAMDELKQKEEFKNSDLYKLTKGVDRAAGDFIEATSPSTYIAPDASPEAKMAIDMLAPYGAAKAVKYAPKALSALARGMDATQEFLMPELRNGGTAFGAGFGGIRPIKNEAWREQFAKGIDPEWAAHWQDELANNPNAVEYLENSVMRDPATGIPYRIRHMQAPRDENFMISGKRGLPPIIEEFDPSQVGSLGPGIYTSGNEATYNEYANRLGKLLPLANEYNMVANVENPFIMPYRDKTRQVWTLQALHSLHDKPEQYEQFAKAVIDENNKFKEFLQREGHDAVITTNPQTQHAEMSVMYPDQLKEIGNRGTYSLIDPSIWKALGPTIPLSALLGAQHMSKEEKAP